MLTKTKKADSSSSRSFFLPGGVYNATPPRIIFGTGTLTRVVEEVEHYKAKRALVVCTPGRTGLARRISDMLGDRCVGILPEAVSQVPIELTYRGQVRATELDADCIV